MSLLDAILASMPEERRNRYLAEEAARRALEEWLRTSRWNASVDGLTGEAIKPGEAVVMQWVYGEIFATKIAGDPPREEPRSCLNCLRPVWPCEYGSQRRTHVYCCGLCRRQHYSVYRQRAARAAKAAAQFTTCPTCNASFTPARSDAKFCSNRCRQKTFRKSLRIRQRVQDTRLDICNAVTEVDHD